MRHRCKSILIAWAAVLGIFGLGFYCGAWVKTNERRIIMKIEQAAEDIGCPCRRQLNHPPTPGEQQ